MSKQVLDVKQMQRLEKLGVDTSKANFYWHRTKSLNNYEEWDEWELHYGVLKLARGFTTINCEYVRTFTLQDILDLLPICIIHEGENYELCIQRMYFNGGKIMHAVYYRLQYNVHWYVMQSYEELIDSAYEMLCWCIENGYKQTDYDKNLLL